MISNRNLFILGSILLLFFIVVSSYYSVISPPPLGTFTTDEHFIGDSGVFLLYGNPPKNLDWPALPSTFIAYIIFLIQCTLYIIEHITEVKSPIDIFNFFDFKAFYYLQHKEEFVIWERTTQLFLTSYFVFKTMQFIAYSKHKLLTIEAKSIFIILVVSSSAIWSASFLIRPEALSGSLFLYIVFKILFTEKILIKEARVFVVLYMLVCSQRFIFLFLSPFILGTLYIHLKGQKIALRTYLNYGLFMIVLMFALVPFLITDTFMVFKAFLGGILAKLNHSQMETFINLPFIFSVFKNPINILFLFLSLLGYWFMIKKYPSRIITYLFLGNIFLFLFSSLRSSELYPSHVFPVTIISNLSTGFGLLSLIQLLKGNSKWISILAFSLILVISSTQDLYITHTNISDQQKNLAQAINWIKSNINKDDKILLDLDFEGFIPKNKECLIREFKANNDEKYLVRKLSNMLKLNTSDSTHSTDIPVLVKSFASEDEKLLDFQYRVLLKYADTNITNSFNTYYLFVNNETMSHCLVQEDALKRFDQGEFHYLVTKIKLLNHIPIKSFGESFWVYENNKN